MKKLLFRFLLSISILLFSSIAHKGAAITPGAQVKLSKGLELADSEYPTNSLDLIISSSSSSKGIAFDRIGVAESEDEEDKLVSYKKLLSGNYYFVPTFCVQTPGYFFSYPGNTLAFYPALKSSALSRCLLLQVFRL